MVTTNSTLDYIPYNLLVSGIPEDRELFDKTVKTLSAIKESLVPLLPYVDQVLKGGLRGVIVAQSEVTNLALGRDGKFHVLGSGDTRYGESDNHWRYYPLEAILRSLDNLLWEAVKKKEAHLTSLKKRSAMLNEIMKVINEAKK